MDNIVLMAMRKERERRYESVEQFAGDIQTYIWRDCLFWRKKIHFHIAPRNLSVAIKPESPPESALPRRSIAGIITTTRQSRIAKKERDIASEQSRIAEKERDTAKREVRKAEKINRFLQKMLASPDPRVVGKDVKVLEILEIAAATNRNEFYQSTRNRRRFAYNYRVDFFESWTF